MSRMKCAEHGVIYDMNEFCPVCTKDMPEFQGPIEAKLTEKCYCLGNVVRYEAMCFSPDHDNRER